MSTNVYIILDKYLKLKEIKSYMSAHVLLNLLNELGKIDKKRGLSNVLSLFRKEFNKFNNRGARTSIISWINI